MYYVSFKNFMKYQIFNKARFMLGYCISRKKFGLLASLNNALDVSKNQAASFVYK